ncbi:MAG: sensor histidine kinase [Pseudomonadota bacterium]
MNDMSYYNTADTKRRNLTVRFCVAALLVTSLIVFAITAASHYQMRAQAMGVNFEELAEHINRDIFAGTDLQNAIANTPQLISYWASIAQLPEVQGGAFFDTNQRLLWSSGANQVLSEKEQATFSTLLDGNRSSRIVDTHIPRLTSLEGFFGSSNQPITGLIALRDDNGNPLGVLKLVRNYDYILRGVEQAVRGIFVYILIGNMLLFFALFYNFLRGVKTIESQEKTLNQQITRLSNLLSINKSMQKSMKTASSRAVELNEQFLRRVGSDLHDGPAQSIGYAILRLNRVSQEEAAKELSHEFHVVKDALDSSLTEIRDISSGLVLPELEQMTLTQSLKKVVVRHSANADTEVTQYYKDLPDQIPLPIKICAYRFVQEGLNNAHRHGQAEKCRVTAFVKDDVLHLSLKDNGMGFRKSQLNTEGGHLGLMGLKDRIESLGGRFSINSELGVGTAIKVSVALTDEV